MTLDSILLNDDIQFKSINRYRILGVASEFFNERFIDKHIYNIDFWSNR